MSTRSALNDFNSRLRTGMCQPHPNAVDKQKQLRQYEEKHRVCLCADGVARTSEEAAEWERKNRAGKFGEVLGKLHSTDRETPLILEELRFSREELLETRELGRGNVEDLMQAMADRSRKLLEKGYLLGDSEHATQSDSKRIARFVYQMDQYRVEFWYRIDDTDFGPVPQPDAPPAVNPTAHSDVQDATYTVVRPNGDHRTYRLRTAESGGLKGKRIVEYLCGGDNERDYAGFAFLQPTGQISLWGRFRTPKGEELLRDFACVLRPGEAQAAGERYAMQSGRCCRCNRKLTVPASLHRGMGPECAQKGGL